MDSHTNNAQPEDGYAQHNELRTAAQGTNGRAMPKEQAKQLAYASRIVMTSLQDSWFQGKVPDAYDVRVFDDGSVLLRAFHMPEDVVMANEVDLPAPIVTNRNNYDRVSEPDSYELDSAAKLRRENRRRPAAVPEATRTHRRILESNHGDVRVLG